MMTYLVAAVYIALLTVPFAGPRLADLLLDLRVRVLASIYCRRHAPRAYVVVRGPHDLN